MNKEKYFIEIRDQQHEMIIEGSSDIKPIESEIQEIVQSKGFLIKNFSTSFDTVEFFWRFHSDIVKG